MRKLAFLLALAGPFVCSGAYASGFELREVSAAAQGTAYAGAAATNSDPSYLFYNPASLAGVADWDASFNATGLILGSSGKFTGTTAAGTPAGGSTSPNGFIGDALVPAMALRYRLDDRWAIGLSLSVPWGEDTKYPSTWTGRYYALSTSLTSYNAQPVVSYQLTPEVTLAAGAQIQYTRANLGQVIDFGTVGDLLSIPGAVPGADDGRANLHGHSWDAGYVLGLAWQPVPDLSLGVSYRSEIHQTLKGSETFTYDNAGIASAINGLTGAFTNSGGKTDVPSPAVIDAGGRWRIDDRWSALAGVEYTNWSSFHQLFIQSGNPDNPSSLTALNWKDTWFGSLGAEYRADDRWTLRAGTAFDEGAAPPQTIEPRIPDADRYWISGGLGYRWSDHTDLNFAVSHLFTPHSTVDQVQTGPGNTFRGSLSGVSNSDATLVSLQVVLR